MTYESRLGPQLNNPTPTPSNEIMLNSPLENFKSFGVEFSLQAIGPTNRDMFYISRSILKRDFQMANTTHGFYTPNGGAIKKPKGATNSNAYVRAQRYNSYPTGLQDMLAAANYYYTNGNTSIENNWFCDVDLVRYFNYIPVLQLCNQYGGEEIGQDPRCLLAKVTRKDKPDELGHTVVATNINKKGFLLVFTEGNVPIPTEP